MVLDTIFPVHLSVESEIVAIGVTKRTRMDACVIEGGVEDSHLVIGDRHAAAARTNLNTREASVPGGGRAVADYVEGPARAFGGQILVSVRETDKRQANLRLHHEVIRRVKGQIGARRGSRALLRARSNRVAVPGAGSSEGPVKQDHEIHGITERPTAVAAGHGAVCLRIATG